MQSAKKREDSRVTKDQGKRVVAIEPTNQVGCYVPYYDPGVVYGDWPYPDYPPEY